jgi:hypothetical protein
MFRSLHATVTLPHVLPYLRSGSVLIIGLLQFWICFQILKDTNCSLELKTGVRTQPAFCSNLYVVPQNIRIISS